MQRLYSSSQLSSFNIFNFPRLVALYSFLSQVHSPQHFEIQNRVIFTCLLCDGLYTWSSVDVCDFTLIEMEKLFHRGCVRDILNITAVKLCCLRKDERSYVKTKCINQHKRNAKGYSPISILKCWGQSVGDVELILHPKYFVSRLFFG